MGFRFYRRISILPGLRVNLSKSGVSASVGGRGAWLTVGKNSPRATVGLPGTGVSYTTTASGVRSTTGRVVFWLILVLAVCFALFRFLK